MQMSYEVEGMHCGSCAARLTTALEQVEGVREAQVSVETSRATIDADDGVEFRQLDEAVRGAGEYRLVAPAANPNGAAAGASTSTGAAASPAAMMEATDEPPESLYPLFLIVGYILGVTLLVGWASGVWAVETQMRHFMAGFFLVFSFFKLLDLRGFVSAYYGYDLVARAVPAWGWVYPFVELGLGIAYLLALAPVVTNVVTLALMLVGAAGVLRALLDKKRIRCACLGTALNLPMTKVTLIEDLTMAAMAAGMLALMWA